MRGEIVELCSSVIARIASDEVIHSYFFAVAWIASLALAMTRKLFLTSHRLRGEVEAVGFG
jgi:hypothetical protein